MDNNFKVSTGNQHITAVENMVTVERVSLNISQSVIVTTEDKVRLSLESYIKKQNRRLEYIAPFSLLIAIIATLTTADFHDFLLDSATWKAMLVITGIIALGWFFRSILFLRDQVSIDDLIDDLKRGNSVTNDDKNGSGVE
jgi:uncharacterized membrane protein YciS (DUF1049 family)